MWYHMDLPVSHVNHGFAQMNTIRIVGNVFKIHKTKDKTKPWPVILPSLLLLNCYEKAAGFVSHPGISSKFPSSFQFPDLGQHWAIDVADYLHNFFNDSVIGHEAEWLRWNTAITQDV